MILTYVTIFLIHIFISSLRFTLWPFFFFERLLFIYFHHTVKFLGGKVIHYPLSLLTIKLNNESGYFLPSRLFFLPYEIIKAVRLDAIERLTLIECSVLIGCPLKALHLTCLFVNQHTCLWNVFLTHYFLGGA